MTGDELIAQFERDTTPAGSFHHADHVRLAFEYLLRHSTLDALERFSTALKEFAAAQGKAQLYHETITWAYLFLIRERMVRGQTWQDFAAANPDLLTWERGSRGILAQYYAAETLASDAARASFILPDRTLQGV